MNINGRWMLYELKLLRGEGEDEDIEDCANERDTPFYH